MDAASGSAKRRNRLRLFAALGVVGLIAIGFGAYWLLFRDDAPASVDSDEAAAARQEAIEAAVDEAATEPADAPVEPAQSDTEVDVGQPDAAASIGAATDGVWRIDTSIGTFGPQCLTDVCDSTFAGFRINEELAGIGAKTVVGRTPGVDGTMELSGSQILAADITVDMQGLITDSAGRTDALRGTSGGLETDTFPTATFVLTQPIDMGSIPPEGASVQVDAVGDLTVHGVTKTVTIPLTAEHQAGLIIVFGNLEDIPLTDFDIPTPTAVVVLSVEDTAIMELQLFFSRA